MSAASRTIEVFFVGDSREDASQYEPFLFQHEAEEFADRTAGKVYKTFASIGFANLRPVKRS